MTLLLLDTKSTLALTVGSGSCIQDVGTTGGVTSTTVSGDCVTQFTAVGSNTWVVPANVTSVWVLVIGGGGGGGGDEGGGGGAGGYREITNFAVTSGATISITVGDGGAGGNSDTTTGSNGGSSTFGSITSAGGGGGGTAANTDATARNGRDGGSGGGGAGEARSTSGGLGNRPAVTPSQGNDGGGSTTSNTFGAGGGGAGEIGDTDGQSYGGDGIASSITGTSVFRAGGGSGGAGNSTTNSIAASAGGGGLGGGTNREGTAGTDGTGGGGGGSGGTTLSGASGGSGIVIVRFTPDTTAPTVTNVTSSTTNGSYSTGTTIPIQVTFSETVTVTGTPQLTLETGSTDRTINYASGSGTTTLTFNYVVQAGDTTSDLNYFSTTSLALNSGTIKDMAGNNATLTLPGLTSAGSLGVNKALIIDTTAPSVVNVTSTVSDGPYGLENLIPIQITFSETVIVTSSARLTLETGSIDRMVSYTSGSGTQTLTFNYTVQAGDTTADLDYLSTTSLIAFGGTLRDAAGNSATLTLPTPGASGSLSSNKTIIIDTTAPSLSSLTLGSSGSSITMLFSESISTTAPDVSRFSVSDSGTTLSVTATSVSGTTVILTLSSSIRAGRVVTLSYLLAGVGNRIQDLATNDASYFSDQPVTNNSTVLNPLTTPASLAVTSVETNTATFTYTPTTNASSHTLRLYDSATATLLSTTTSFTSGSSLTSLTPATRYYVTLQAVGNGTVYESSSASSPVSFTTLIRPALITSQPLDTATTTSRSAGFAVTASAQDGGTLTYQWQRSVDGGANFSAISGATSATLSLSSLTTASNGYRYRVVITNSRYSVSATETSTAATLTVNPAISLSGGSNLSSPFGVSASSSVITISGGTGDITFTLSGSTTGLSINASTGVVTTDGSTPRGTVSLTITATDQSGATATQSITVTISTGSSTITLAFSTPPKKGTPLTITATTSVAGTVRFFENGRVISACRSRSTSGTNPITAICNWRPRTHGSLPVKATLTPTSADYTSSIATASVIVTKRTAQRS